MKKQKQYANLKTEVFLIRIQLLSNNYRIKNMVTIADKVDENVHFS